MHACLLSCVLPAHVAHGLDAVDFSKRRLVIVGLLLAALAYAIKCQCDQYGGMCCFMRWASFESRVRNMSRWLLLAIAQGILPGWRDGLATLAVLVHRFPCFR